MTPNFNEDNSISRHFWNFCSSKVRERERERDGERQFLPNEIKAKLEIKISQIFDQINEIKNLN